MTALTQILLAGTADLLRGMAWGGLDQFMCVRREIMPDPSKYATPWVQLTRSDFVGLYQAHCARAN